jgi:NAD(P)-dependent dehydrogenase (short-subunit alcohol dehydrogenase family)
MNGWWNPATVAQGICVVGAAGGIGMATARLLAGQGVKLMLMDRTSPELASLAGELGAAFETLDYRTPASIVAAMTRARAKFPAIGGLALLGGIVDTAKLADLTLERWEDVLRVNLTGTFLAIQAAREWLCDGAAIVTTSSLAASTGGVITGTAYAASKAGIEAMTKSVAQELAPRRIRANCVSPGAIDTPMTAGHPPERKRAFDAAVPLKRHGHADEVAATICFLLSAGAGYITGAVVPVNGGFRME